MKTKITRSMIEGKRPEWKRLWEPVQDISNNLGHVLYALNTADNAHGSGMVWGIAGRPFDMILEGWREMIRLQFGFEDLEINWGSTGGDTFALDLRDAVRDEWDRQQ